MQKHQSVNTLLFLLRVQRRSTNFLTVFLPVSLHTALSSMPADWPSSHWLHGDWYELGCGLLVLLPLPPPLCRSGSFTRRGVWYKCEILAARSSDGKEKATSHPGTLYVHFHVNKSDGTCSQNMDLNASRAAYSNYPWNSNLKWDFSSKLAYFFTSSKRTLSVTNK